MNFLGVGAWELLAILLIMLVFAGPKRMIHWSYVLGQHVAKFRKIWSETVDLVQKEFDDAGVGIKLPKEPPTRKSLNKSLTEAVKPMTQPVQDSLAEVKQDVATFREVSEALNDKKPKPAAAAGKPQTAMPAPAASAPKKGKGAQPKAPATSPPKQQSEPLALGSWGGGRAGAPAATPKNGSEGSEPDLGTWAGGASGD